MATPSGCPNCDAWGYRGLCNPCRVWVTRYPSDTCSNCGHRLPVKNGLCRACLIHLHWFGHGNPLQLWFGGRGLALTSMVTPAATGYTVPSGRPGRVREQRRNREARRRPVSDCLAPAGQMLLFYVDRDWTRLNLSALPSLTPAAAALVDELERYGHEQGWITSTVKQASRTLRTLLSWLGADAKVDERDLRTLVRVQKVTCSRRVRAFLETREMLEPLPTRRDHHEAAVERAIAEAPAQFRGDIDRWVHVLRGQGRRRHQALQWSTIRKYLSYLRLVLPGWAERFSSLREVAVDDVDRAVKAVTGTTAHDRHVALRSLFGALRQERLIFRDPTLGISLPGHCRPPVGLPTGTLPTLFAQARTPIARAIITLIAVHALTPTTVRMLRLDQVNLAAGRIALGPRKVVLDEFTHRILTEWLRERQQRWPRTRNPFLLVSTQTAADVRNPPITEVNLHRHLSRLGVHATQLRTDRVLDEARHTADPVALMRLFGLSATTAMNYVTAAHPDKGVNIKR